MRRAWLVVMVAVPSACMRLGINGQTSRHMRHMVDNDLLPEVGCYELPHGVTTIDINNESDDQ